MATTLGLHALQLMVRKDKPVSVSEIARSGGFKPSGVRRVLRLLGLAGLVESRPSRGFALARAPGEISVLDVVRATQAPQAPAAPAVETLMPARVELPASFLRSAAAPSSASKRRFGPLRWSSSGRSPWIFLIAWTPESRVRPPRKRHPSRGRAPGARP